MHKRTLTQVYNLIVAYAILKGLTQCQANIYAVKKTWYLFNNQHLIKRMLI